MTNNKQEQIRLPYIMVGLILGFFLGSGIMYWHSNSQNGSIIYNKALSYLAAVSDDPESKDSQSAFSLHSGHNKKNASDSTSGTKEGISANPDSIYTQKEPVKTDISLSILHHSDSLGIEDYTPLVLDGTQHSDLRMMQDSLLQIRAFSIQKQNEANDRYEYYRKLDSLLGNLNENIPGKTLLNIEFWVSPIQYSGYRKSNNRVIIYGLEHPELAELHVAGKNLLLEYNGEFFLLVDNDVFQPFTSITDQEIIDQLNYL